MAKTLCLLSVALLGVVAGHPWGEDSGEMEGGFYKEKMEKLGMLINLEQALREKTEQRVYSNPEMIDEVHEQFVK